MKIILLKEVQGFGHVGETKEVSDGYARNFLIPKGLAAMATKHTLKVVGDQKAKKVRQAQKSARSKELLAKKINKKTFEIKAKADEKGTLYAGIDKKLLAEELRKQGVELETSEIKLKENIKKIGDYEIDIILGKEKAVVKLKVV